MSLWVHIVIYSIVTVCTIDGSMENANELQ